MTASFDLLAFSKHQQAPVSMRTAVFNAACNTGSQHALQAAQDLTSLSIKEAGEAIEPLFEGLTSLVNIQAWETLAQCWDAWFKTPQSPFAKAPLRVKMENLLATLLAYEDIDEHLLDQLDLDWQKINIQIHPDAGLPNAPLLHRWITQTTDEKRHKLAQSTPRAKMILASVACSDQWLDETLAVLYPQPSNDMRRLKAIEAAVHARRETQEPEPEASIQRLCKRLDQPRLLSLLPSMFSYVLGDPSLRECVQLNLSIEQLLTHTDAIGRLKMLHAYHAMGLKLDDMKTQQGGNLAHWACTYQRQPYPAIVVWVAQHYPDLFLSLDAAGNQPADYLAKELHLNSETHEFFQNMTAHLQACHLEHATASAPASRPALRM